MAKEFIEIAHTQVQFLEPNDVFRFIDPHPDDEIAKRTGGWLKLVKSDANENGGFDLEVDNDA